MTRTNPGSSRRPGGLGARRAAYRALTFLAVFTALSATPARGTDSLGEERARAYFREQERRFAERNLDGFLLGYASEFQTNGMVVTREELGRGVTALFRHPHATYRTEISAVEDHNGFVSATVTSHTEFGESRESAVHDVRTAVWILEPTGGERLQVVRRFSVRADAQTRYRDRRYASPSGGYELRCPEGWILFVPAEAPERSTFDLVWLYRHRTGSIASVAVVDLPPTPIDSERLAAIELDNMVAATGDETRVLLSEAAEVDGIRGWKTDVVSAHREETFHVRRYHVTRGRLYYTLYFQALDERRFRQDLAAFESVRSSFRFRPAEVPRAGRIDAGHFFHEESGCELRPPEGWSLSLGASGHHFRVFAVPDQPLRGDESRVVFFAHRFGRRGTPDEEAVRAHLERVLAKLEMCVPGVVRLSRLEPIRAGGLEGRQITITLPARTVPRVRKIAVFAREGDLFVFHCDAIPPSRYQALESRFDALIAGLAFRP